MNQWSHPVASFWAGSDLSFIEQMVIRSYQDAGCDFTLYVAGTVAGIPSGTTVRNAAEILAVPDDIGPAADRKRLAVWSDIFRIALLQQREVIWADLDAYCVAPFAASAGYLFGHNDEGNVLTGVLALPPQSAELRIMRDLLFAEEVAPPWREARWIELRRKKGLLRAIDLPWGDTGPRLLSHALETTGAMQHAAPPAVFYPLFRNSLPLIWTPNVPDDRIITPEVTRSVHIFGFTKRLLTTFHEGLPPANSWLANRAAQHGIDPRDAPAIGEPLGQPAPTTEHVRA